MSRIARIIALVLAGAAGPLSASELAPASQVQITSLVKTDLAGAPWQEMQIYTVEFSPGAATEQPPGHSLVYVLAGAARLMQAGKPPVLLTAGEAFHGVLQSRHGLQNLSKTQPAMLVMFAVTPKEDPYWTQPM